MNRVLCLSVLLGSSLASPCARVIVLEGHVWNRTPGLLDVTPLWVRPDPTDGTRGCFHSHVTAIRQAYESDCDHLLLFEEDVFLTPAADEAFTSGLSFLEDRKWDLFYLGHDPWGLLTWTSEPKAPTIVRTSFSLQTHAYVLSKPFLHRFLSSKASEWSGVRVDEALFTLRPTAYAAYPMVAFQHHHLSTATPSNNVGYVDWSDPDRVVSIYRDQERDALHTCRCKSCEGIDSSSSLEWHSVCDDACKRWYFETHSFDHSVCSEPGVWCDSSGMTRRLLGHKHGLILPRVLSGWNLTRLDTDVDRTEFEHFTHRLSVDKRSDTFCETTFHDTTSTLETLAAFHVVVSHCTHDLGWLKRFLFGANPLSITVFSKCGTPVTGVPDGTRVERLPNVGRNDHTWAFSNRHLSEEWNDDDTIVFLKDTRLIHQDGSYRSLGELRSLSMSQGFGCLLKPERGSSFHRTDLLRTFRKSVYTHPDGSRSPPTFASRWVSLGEWGDELGIEFAFPVCKVCYGGSFATQVRKVRSQRELWPRMVRSLERGDDIEEGHFAERSWAAILSDDVPASVLGDLALHSFGVVAGSNSDIPGMFVGCTDSEVSLFDPSVTDVHLAFHFPKTGGTSLRNVWKRIAHGIGGEMQLLYNERVPNLDRIGLRMYDPTHPAGIIYGHALGYGQSLGDDVLRRFPAGTRVQYHTFVRDPNSWVRSLYHYQNPDKAIDGWMTALLQECPALVRSMHASWCSSQLIWWLSPSVRFQDYSGLTHHHKCRLVAQGWSNVRIGWTDDFENSVSELETFFGLEPTHQTTHQNTLAYRRENATEIQLVQALLQQTCLPLIYATMRSRRRVNADQGRVLIQSVPTIANTADPDTSNPIFQRREDDRSLKAFL